MDMAIDRTPAAPPPTAMAVARPTGGISSRSDGPCCAIDEIDLALRTSRRRRRDERGTAAPPPPRNCYGTVPAAGGSPRDEFRRRRRRCPLAPPSPASLVVAVAALAIASVSTTTRLVEAFAPGMPVVAAPRADAATLLNAVHKRPGNRSASAAASIATTRRAQRKKGAANAAQAAAAPTLESPVVSSSPPPPASAHRVRSSPSGRGGGKKSNVFEQFTPDYMSSPFDVDLSPREPEDFTRRNGAPASAPSAPSSAATRIKKSNKINLRLQSLLRDDTGEQEMEMFPDHSPEAANQLADLKSYSKLSEEARRKANIAVSAGGDGGDGGEEPDAAGASAGGSLAERRRKLLGKQRGGGAAGAEEAGRPGGDGPASGADGGSGGSRVTLAGPTSSTVRTRRVRATVKETGSDSISNYIKSLGQHELLYKEDEVLLGRQVRILVALEEKRQMLEEDLLRPPTFAQWAEATNHTVPSLKQQIRRSQRAKAALIEANLRLVITVARQAVKKSPLRSSQGATSVQFQDACQQGIIGLTRATEKFDPELGFRFSTYAIWWIQKEVAKNVSDQSRTVRVPPSAIKKINDIRIAERVLMNELGRRPRDEELAEKVGMSVDKLNFYRQSAKEVSSLDRKVEARTGKGSSSSGGDSSGGDTMDMFVKDTEHTPSELIDQQMLKEDIRRLIRTLSPREQAVIRLRFGLDDGKPLGLADISAKFGVEKDRIKKIEARALLKLRQPSRSQVVRCYVSDHT